MLKKGDKVVCIDDSPSTPTTMRNFKFWIKKDLKYTVRSTHNSLHGPQGVLLEELRNPAVDFPSIGGKAEPGYAEFRFRKLDTVDGIVAEEVEESELVNA